MMIVIPVMPRFIELIGGSAFVFGVAFSIGLGFAIQGLGRFLSNIPAGVLSDRIGRKWVIIIGGLGVALFATLSGLSDSVPMFLVFRFFSGVASAMTIVVANVVAADLSTAENRGRVLGLMHGLQLVVGTGSPALGGLVGEVLGTRMPFYVSGIAVLAFALWGILRLPETRPAPGPQSASHSRHSGFGSGARVLLRDPSFLMVCILGFSTFFLRGGMSTTLIPHTGERRPQSEPVADRPALHCLIAHAQRPHLPRRSHIGQVRAEDRHRPRRHTRRPCDHSPAFLRDVRALRNVVPAAAHGAGLGRTSPHRLRGRPRASEYARHGHRHVQDVRRRCRHHRPRHLDEPPGLLLQRRLRIQRGAMDDNRRCVRLRRSRNGGDTAQARARSATGCGRGDPGPQR